MATILVIDDERMLCDLFQEVLRRHGHEAFTAYSGREGIESHWQRPPQPSRNPISGRGPEIAPDRAREHHAPETVSALRRPIVAAASLPPEEANHVLYVVREAMSNSLRHSRAKTGDVSLRLLKRNVRLEVTDDGVGFDMHKKGKHGEGLHNMMARAKEIGARSVIPSHEIVMMSQRRNTVPIDQTSDYPVYGDDAMAKVPVSPCHHEWRRANGWLPEAKEREIMNERATS